MTLTGPHAARSSAMWLWLLTIALSVAALVLLGVGRSASLPNSWGFRGFLVSFAVTFGSVGALIRNRVPGNRVGWLFVAIGLGSGLTAFVQEYVIFGALVRPGSVPFVTQIAWLEAWIWAPIAATAATYLLLLFPDGRLAAPKWRPVGWFVLVTIVYLSVALAVVPGPIENASFIENPLGIAALRGNASTVLIAIGFAMLTIAILLSAASLVLRFRRSRGVERQQLKWFALAAAFAGLVLAGPGTIFNVFTTGSPATSSSKGFEILTIVALLGIPIAAGIAILRYRLYDIDRIISRTLAYAVLTAVLAAVYLAGFLGIQALLASFTGNGEPVAVAASTLAVFVLFAPVRGRIGAAVERRFYRRRYDAAHEIEGFAARVRDEVELERLTIALASTLERTMQPASASIWLRRA